MGHGSSEVTNVHLRALAYPIGAGVRGINGQETCLEGERLVRQADVRDELLEILAPALDAQIPFGRLGHTASTAG